jgi:hypothetical protein
VPELQGDFAPQRRIPGAIDLAVLATAEPFENGEGSPAEERLLHVLEGRQAQCASAHGRDGGEGLQLAQCRRGFGGRLELGRPVDRGFVGNCTGNGFEPALRVGAHAWPPRVAAWRG